MQAIVVSGPDEYALERVSDPTPGTGEIVVRVRGCGICGTDLHIIHEGLPGMDYPLIPGHEPWGEVADVNGTRSHLRPGDVVAASLERRRGRYLPRHTSGRRRRDRR